MDRNVLAVEPTDLVPCIEAPVLQAKALERRLLETEIPVWLAKPPPKACCGSGCACGSKLQVLVRSEDVPKVGALLREEWLEAVREEGTVQALGAPSREPQEGEVVCPACQFVGALVDGNCQDCGLTLEQSD